MIFINALVHSRKSGHFRSSGPLICVRLFSKTNHNDENNSMLSETIRSLTLQGLPDLSPSKSKIKPPMMIRIKEGLLHYWHGSKLLAYETKISTRLIFKLMKGNDLIRREKRQLLRTTSDLLRLVPFVIIAIIPFLEFALPLILKLFPNMLPSTFEDQLANDEKIRKQIKIKLETAKFLQDAIEEMSASGTISSEAKEFAELYKKARITGESLTLEQLERVCYSLKDSLTLENLDRAHLVSLCRYIGVKAFGTDAFLRYQIRNSLHKLHQDDEEIAKEGVEALFLDELEQACRLRGLFYPGIDANLMRQELNSWLNLHLKKGLPSVILVLSRALSTNMKVHRPEQALKDTILSLPDAVVNEAELLQQEISGSESVCFKQKLEVLEQQQGLIDVELAQEADLKASYHQDNTSNDAKIHKEDLKVLSDAISVMSTPNPVVREEHELKELKEHISEFKSSAGELEILSNNKLKESKAAEIISEKIEKLVGELESDLQSLHDRLGARLNLISADEKGQISLDQLETVFKLIRHSSSESDRLDRIIKAFDKDGDGKVFISDIIEMANQIEKEEGQVDDGSGICNCFVWIDEHGPTPKLISLLGNHVILKGTKSQFFCDIGINICEIYLLEGIQDELFWKLMKIKMLPNS